jgi:hypothetical protein
MLDRFKTKLTRKQFLIYLAALIGGVIVLPRLKAKLLPLKAVKNLAAVGDTTTASRPAETQSCVMTPTVPPVVIPGARSMTTASRTTGVAPLAVFFDAVDTASPAWSSGVIQPPDSDYASYHYTWDFDDSGSGTFATNGKNKNEATGYVAAHVFENSGTYTVTLTIMDDSGASQTYTQLVTVSAFSGTTYYFDATSGNDANPGTEAQPKKTWSHAISLATANTRLLFKRGETFTDTVARTISVDGPGALATYGTGANPIIQMTVSSRTSLSIAFGTEDWRIIDLDFVGAGGGAQVDGTAIENAGSRILALRCSSANYWTGLGAGNARIVPLDGNFYQECDATAEQTVFYGCGQHLAFLGNTFHDSTITHILRIPQGVKTVVSNNILRNAGPTRHLIKLHSPGAAEGRPSTRYVIISDNELDGVGWNTTVGPQDSLSDERVTEVVLERNIVKRGTMEIFAGAITIRNNFFLPTTNVGGWHAVGIGKRGIEPAPNNVRVLNNSAYVSSSNTNGKSFCYLTGTEFTRIFLRNNAMIWANGAGGDAQGLIVMEDSADITEIDSDYNIWSGPSGAWTWTNDGAWHNYTLAQWQALGKDAHSVFADPQFVNPASGDLRCQASSPAVNTGLSLTLVREDHAQIARPQGGVYDRGASER